MKMKVKLKAYCVIHDSLMSCSGSFQQAGFESRWFR